MDDIISTASTMIKTIAALREQGFTEIACMATHGLFVGEAYAKLEAAGAIWIVTANTLQNNSNGLNVAALLVSSLTAPATRTTR